MEEMSFKENSYLELWQTFCSAEQNHLCNFGRGCYEEQFCEIILIWAMAQMLCKRAVKRYAILTEGVIRNIHVKFFEIWTSGSGGDVV